MACGFLMICDLFRRSAIPNFACSGKLFLISYAFEFARGTLVIIDSHTHIYPDFVAKKALNTVVTNIGNRLTPFTDGTFEGLTASMDAAGVDLSIVLMIATSPGHGSRILQWIQAMMSCAPRMIFFGSVHPYDANYRELIREMAE